MLKTSWKYALVLVCAATLACNSGKAPAEAAMKLAEEAVSGARTEAQNLVPDDVKSLAVPVLRHRVVLAPGAEIEGTTAETVVRQVLEQVPAPR